MKTTRGRVVIALAALWSLAFLVRLAFLRSSPGATGSHSPWLVGDARVFLEHAQARLANAFDVVDLGLPLRPPGTAWLLACFWDGSASGLASARLGFAAIGAAVAPLSFLFALPLGRAVAWFAGIGVALAFPLIVLSSTFTAETPYLALSLLSLLLARGLHTKVTWTRSLSLGVLTGITALVRAEHLLLAALVCAWIIWRHRRSMRVALPFAGWFALGAVITLLPWQLEAARRIQSFQRSENPPCPPRRLDWTAAAVEQLSTVPGFARAATQRFVEVTLEHRGHSKVDRPDLDVVTEAFGWWPEPLPGFVPVALYGPLNFALANAGEGSAGFSRARLDREPQLLGGREQYSPNWLRALPTDGQLSLAYPPHLYLLEHGYRDGLAEIASEPGRALGRGFAKLAIALRGATGGFGSANLPLGSSGLRRSVDLAAPDGWPAICWSALWVLLAAVGYVQHRRSAEAQLLGLVFVSLAAVTVAFFGYARLGAIAQPGILLLAALALRDRIHGKRLGVAFAAIAVLLLAQEVRRMVRPPVVTFDGIEFAVLEAEDGIVQREHRLDVR
ncbi:MAG: hypothetical protein AB7T19_00330 [Planctomycetota bacterium]